ncbi:GNAT family N-acetyltransferase [Virgibacillus phasianinus]|uniref:GNAT family N-acetyltransferase n=1 Tax=Virgibacillus phasianinus TaxID=2017483 RepID=A0A220TZE0_9BACI|nr:GNAT family protein [Virgibacillus phasianinus]ASK61135.1 GNAT family N-acetyltransferase [Virgibacillus phasianinus]
MNPILLDFPHEFETERLLLRMPIPGDGEAVHEAITASINELRPWMGFAQNDQTKAEVETNTREAHISFLKREKLRMLVFLKDTNQFVGSSGLHNIDWDVRKFEIGYWGDTRFCGKGYMTEAIAGLTVFTFNELHANRVQIQCDSRNSRSRAIPERLGYELEGIIRNEDLSVDGKELRDTCMYAKVKGR